VDWLLEAIIILALFILRLGVPLLIILAVGYWLRRLDAKWQAEARAQAEANESQKAEANEPEIEPFRIIKEPCWLLKKCSETIYTQCPAYQHPDLPCWLARYQATGRLPAGCPYCQIFTQRQSKQHIIE
jgi:hypothetical protein